MNVFSWPHMLMIWISMAGLLVKVSSWAVNSFIVEATTTVYPIAGPIESGSDCIGQSSNTVCCWSGTFTEAGWFFSIHSCRCLTSAISCCGDIKDLLQWLMLMALVIALNCPHTLFIASPKLWDFVLGVSLAAFDSKVRAFWYPLVGLEYWSKLSVIKKKVTIHYYVRYNILDLYTFLFFFENYLNIPPISVQRTAATLSL